MSEGGGEESKTLGIRLEKCTFYFDLDNASFLPKLTKYVTMAGAVSKFFLLIDTAQKM
jgi:hypothetical protein